MTFNVFNLNDTTSSPLAIIYLTPELIEQIKGKKIPHRFPYIDEYGQEREGLLTFEVTNQGEKWVAFENSCPHGTLPFVGGEGVVDVVVEERKIRCLRHGATFAVEDGYAIGELCAGQTLIVFDVDEVANTLQIFKKRVSWAPSF